MELIREVDANEQSGKPICEKWVSVVMLAYEESKTRQSTNYLSQAEAEPRNNLGHSKAASAYFLSTIKWSRYLDPT